MMIQCRNSIRDTPLALYAFVWHRRIVSTLHLVLHIVVTLIIPEIKILVFLRICLCATRTISVPVNIVLCLDLAHYATSRILFSICADRQAWLMRTCQPRAPPSNLTRSHRLNWQTIKLSTHTPRPLNDKNKRDSCDIWKQLDSTRCAVCVS